MTKTIAADSKHLGAEIGATMALHTWGQTLTHHLHVHCIVPGGGLALAPVAGGQPKAHQDAGKTWIACRPRFFLPVRVLSRLYRRLFLDKLGTAHRAGKLKFFNDQAPLADTKAFAAAMALLRRTDWVVFAKKPFAGPEQVFAYLSRYTHRIAISHRRLVASDDIHVAFNWRDYAHGSTMKIMRLDAHEFLRRFLLHVLPMASSASATNPPRRALGGFLANGHRKAKLAAIRKSLAVAVAPAAVESGEDTLAAEAGETPLPCPCCGGPMTIIEFLAGPSRHQPPRRDTS